MVTTRSRTLRSLLMDRRIQRVLVALASTAVALAIAWPIYRSLRATPQGAAPAPNDYDGPAFHILIVGGSVPLGCPYQEHLDFGRILAWMYGNEIDGLPIVVKNLAGLGEDSIAELADARTLLEEERDPKHAVLLYYTGNNELVRFGGEIDFGKRDRKLFDERLVPHEEWDKVMLQFEDNVRTIVREARAKGVATILSTASENLAWEPDRSVLANPANEDAVRKELDAGEELAERGEHAQALEHWQAVLALEPHFAWASQRKGDALRALGRFDEAYAAYQAAIDDNGAATVATSRHNAIVRAVARSENVPIVDAEALMRKAAPNGLPGFELFWDNCHPTVDGYRILALAFEPEVTRLFGKAPLHPDPKNEEIEKALGFDAEFVARVELLEGQFCYVAACLIWNPTTRLAMSREYLDRSSKVLADNVELTCSRAVLALFQRDLPRSRDLWRQAIAQDSKAAHHRLKHKYIRGLLRDLGVDDGKKWVE